MVTNEENSVTFKMLGDLATYVNECHQEIAIKKEEIKEKQREIREYEVFMGVLEREILVQEIESE